MRDEGEQGGRKDHALQATWRSTGKSLKTARNEGDENSVGTCKPERRMEIRLHILPNKGETDTLG